MNRVLDPRDIIVLVVDKDHPHYGELGDLIEEEDGLKLRIGSIYRLELSDEGNKYKIFFRSKRPSIKLNSSYSYENLIKSHHSIHGKNIKNYKLYELLFGDGIPRSYSSFTLH